MANINIELKQLGKEARTLQLEAGTTIGQLLEDELQMEANGLSFSVENRNGVSTQSTGYELKNFDTLTISANNKGA